ncbi:hypothetical protein QFC24_002461 [Naganishia onofrii]|uniref:Uncharacterized protein n=1 Tax=Naganishia onofrii TaxID=1851511 RepID=A0ACC2XQ92_9TREE|nr:hypothetical protein QFC24_002461 [Naganishia onofrii]
MPSMAYKGTSDVQAVSPAETNDQLQRESTIPKIIITDESDFMPPPDETAVLEATVPADVPRIPLYEEEEQAYIPSYQYMQQQENQNSTYTQAAYNQPGPGSAGLSVPSTSAAAADAYSYGWGQAPQPYPASLPNNPTMANSMAIFDPAALQRLSQQLAPRPVNAPTQPQYSQANAAAAYGGYNSSVGYIAPNGYNVQSGYTPGGGYAPPTNSNNWRSAPPSGPARHADRRDGSPRQVSDNGLDLVSPGINKHLFLGVNVSKTRPVKSLKDTRSTPQSLDREWSCKCSK